MIVIEHIKTKERFMFPDTPTSLSNQPQPIPLGFKKSDNQTPVPLHYEDRLRWQNHSQNPLDWSRY